MKINGKFQPGGVITGIIPFPIMNADGSEPEAIVPLDRLHELLNIKINTMTFNGQEVPKTLEKFSFKQSIQQAGKNIIEVAGIEFSAQVVFERPDLVISVIEADRNKYVNKYIDKYIAGHQSANDEGSLGCSGSHKESFVPLDKLYELLTVPDRRRKHIQAIVLMIAGCMETPGITAAYYCAQPIQDIKERFVKVLTDMRVDGDAWDSTAKLDEIQFVNGSKIIFVYSIVCGDFHIVAPMEPVDIKWKDMPLWVDEVKEFDIDKYNRYITGRWKDRP